MKLDLHTHCLEATGVVHPDKKMVEQVVIAVKAAGLDGIAVTEHDNIDHGYRIKQLADKFFSGQILVIPGREIRQGFNHVVELYLPDNTVFRFIAHPGNLRINCPENLDGIHGVEIENGNQVINEDTTREFAKRHNLLLLSNSDAHSLSDIGRHYTDIEIEELYARTKIVRKTTHSS
jgi:predicted metal-dependent phosphoesterase TrpH